MQNPKEEKKRYRVEGLSYSKDPEAFGMALSQTMNRLTEDGYSVQIMPIPDGFVVLGRLEEREESSHALASLVAALTGASEVAEMPGRLYKLFKNISSRLKSEDFESMAKELPAILPSILQELPSASVVKEMAEECDDFAAHHDKTAHSDTTDCDISKFARVLAKEMRGFAKLNVQ